jgi:predicted transcriptional regulator
MRSGNTEKEKTSFEPSRIILPRILRALLENGPLGRTALALGANSNYVTVAQHIVWLEAKSYVEFSIVGGKLPVNLTQSGREFALKIASIPY